MMRWLWTICGVLLTCAVEYSVQTANAGWSPWTRWSCSLSCGGDVVAVMTRSRACASPPPAPGNPYCVGPHRSQKTDICHLPHCPEGGQWTAWSDWSDRPCPVTCGALSSVIEKRTRSCSSGFLCDGDSMETKIKTCEYRECPAGGEWSDWSSWSKPGCPVTCGVKIATTVRKRSRSCLSLPYNSKCEGSSIETELENCEFRECPVDGGFSKWSSWTKMECDITCGRGGNMGVFRTRSCRDPRPQFGGADCSGKRYVMKIVPCDYIPCPIDGSFDHWEPWDNPACPVTCGPSHRRLSRKRTCTKPSPQFGGRNCSGQFSDFEVRKCVGKQPDCAAMEKEVRHTVIGTVVGIGGTLLLIAAVVLIVRCCCKKKGKPFDEFSLVGSNSSYSETIKGVLNIEDFKEKREGLKENGIYWNQPFAKRPTLANWNPEDYPRSAHPSMLLF